MNAYLTLEVLSKGKVSVDGNSISSRQGKLIVKQWLEDGAKSIDLLVEGRQIRFEQVQLTDIV